MFYKRLFFILVVLLGLSGLAQSRAEDAFNVICPQVLTYAKAPYQNCWVTFDTPCEVPEGWEKAQAIPEGEFECTPGTPTDLPDSCPVGMPNPDSFCATFNLFEGTLKVPCFIYGGKRYMLEFSLQGTAPPVFVLKSYKPMQ